MGGVCIAMLSHYTYAAVAKVALLQKKLLESASYHVLIWSNTKYQGVA